MRVGRLAFAVSFASLVLGCNKEGLETGPAPVKTQADTYYQQAVSGKADILFVINDTDNTMVTKATTMGSSASGFINYLVSKAVDFHIAVTTMDMDTPYSPPSFAGPTQARFNGSTKILDPTTASLLSTFQSNLQVGYNGAPIERGLDASVAAVTSPLVTGDNTGFLRPDSRLFVVYLSDEDDQSTGTAASYVADFTAVKGGNASLFVLSAIAGPVPNGCNGGSGSGSGSTGADAGLAYNGVITLSNGLFESICDSDYTTFLNNLGFHAGATQAQFFLSKTPSPPSSIQVEVNGAAVPASQWTYDPTSNSITFVAGSVPAAGAQVVITYQIA